jgi:hypothetical protein
VTPNLWRRICRHGRRAATVSFGHALLTRCKVAALLAIMHGRVEVTEWDWCRSAAVMAVSDETRRGLIQAAEEIKRQRDLDAGAARAVRSEGYEVGRTQSSMRAIVEKLKRHGGDGMARNDLRTSLSTANRHVFDSAAQMLAEDQKWFDWYLAEQREQGRDAVDAVTVREAGIAAGYSLSSLYVAANKRGLKGTTWTLTG